MTLTAALITSGKLPTGNSYIESAAFTPTAGQMIVVDCVMHNDVNMPSSSPILTLTQTHANADDWDWEVAICPNLGGGGQKRPLYRFFAIAPIGSGSGLVHVAATDSVTGLAITGNRWRIIVSSISVGVGRPIQPSGGQELTGVNTASATLDDPPAATSLVLAVGSSAGDSDGMTAGSGFTELAEVIDATETASLTVEYDAASAPQTANFTGGATTNNRCLVTEFPETGARHVLAISDVLAFVDDDRRLTEKVFTDP